jgi:GTP-binding protein
MPVPQVVIVGRPNVGKSSIFNWLAQKRLAIVDDVAGVTRDRVTYLTEHSGHPLELVDTGGIGIEDTDDLTAQIRRQIELAIQSAGVILVVVDVQTGLMPLDQQVAQRLRRVDRPILCVANKADDPSWDPGAELFCRLGHGAPICVSTKTNRNRRELLDTILQHLPPEAAGGQPALEPLMKVAIVGRRNVGKSTFINWLAKAERMIVSHVPGTTRDSVDVRFELDGQALVAIDTPGLRRSKSVRTNVDFYSTHRAQRSVRRADVVLLFFDATDEIGKVDKQLCHYVEGQYKPCIFVVNKWDQLVRKVPTEGWVKYLRETFPTMAHAPIAFITGQSGKNVKALLNHAQMLFKQSRQRVSTGLLNQLVQKALQQHPPSVFRNRRPKIYYATQVAVQPPTIVLVASNPKGFPPDYRRYLLGLLRDQLPFREVPVRLYFRQRRGHETHDRSDSTSEARS